MKRRKVLGWLIFGGASLTTGVSLKWFHMTRKPEIAYLLNHQNLLAELAEVIIPATETPGAKAAKVHSFIIDAVTYCTDVKSINNFLSGLKELERFSHSVFRLPFTDCSSAQKSKILNYFEEKESPLKGGLRKVQQLVLGQSFFSLLKKYTVLGYFTSQAGATLGTRYDYIPGTFHGDILLLPDQKSWATK